jgi:hypothetical protein
LILSVVLDRYGAPRTGLRGSRITSTLPADLEWRARAGRPGVWVSGGDFIDGEFQRIEGDTLRISSVLFGSAHVRCKRRSAGGGFASGDRGVCWKRVSKFKCSMFSFCSLRNSPLPAAKSSLKDISIG